MSYGNRVMETELSFVKRILSYGSHHFWVMSYRNWELSYQNWQSKQALTFKAPQKTITNHHCCPNKKTHIYQISPATSYLNPTAVQKQFQIKLCRQHSKRSPHLNCYLLLLDTVPPTIRFIITQIYVSCKLHLKQRHHIYEA